MSRKSKGCDAERELIHLFWETNDWAASRVAGSGSIKYPAPDIIAANKTKRLAIECKACKGQYQYFDKKEIIELQQFAHMTAAEPIIAVRFNKQQWIFFTPADLDETKNNFVITRDHIPNRGKLFKELTQQETK